MPAQADAARLAAQWQQAHAAVAVRTPIAADTALLLALQWQLERSEWLRPEMLRARQLSQLDALCAHAWREVPFYRGRLQAAGYRPGEPLAWALFRRIPVLRRADLQQAGEALRARTLPAGHGRIHRDATSGSTAEPVRFTASDIVKVMWHALTLREHLWHRRDFRGRLAAIRSVLEPGEFPDWGLPVALLAETGPASGLRVSTAVSEQAAWLAERDPEYLMSYPSNVLALVRECSARGHRLTRLREVRTFGERLPADLRAACRRAWNVPLVDVYSAQEVGCIAFQCPGHEHYHVQAEGVLLEVLDETGESCPAGTLGKVVATSLHNFATPFIRYELGDYAEPGEPCACGRGLPVLRRIAGRARNMARLADGNVFWPRIRASEWFEIAAVRAFRLVQTGLDSMRLEVVTPAALSAAQTDALAANVATRLGHPFRICVVRVQRIERGPADKLDDFVCELTA